MKNAITGAGRRLAWAIGMTLPLFASAQAEPINTDKPTLRIAFVLLREAQLPKHGDVVRAFDRYATGKDQHLRKGAGDRASVPGDATQLFDLSTGGGAFVGLIPKPVPNGEAEEAAPFSVGSLMSGWKVPAHNAHLIVMLQSAAGTPALEALTQFTSLLAAVTEASDAVGVYWGNAGATYEPKFFLSIAQDKSTSARMMVWTGVSRARDADGRMSFLSLGMGQLGLPDLLLVASKQAAHDALPFFFDLLASVAKEGKPIPEGDTVGRTDDERLPVHYEASPTDPERQVWRVELK